MVHELPSATFAITSNQKLIIGAGYSYYNFILNLSWSANKHIREVSFTTGSVEKHRVVSRESDKSDSLDWLEQMHDIYRHVMKWLDHIPYWLSNLTLNNVHRCLNITQPRSEVSNGCIVWPVWDWSSLWANSPKILCLKIRLVTVPTSGWSPADVGRW